MSLLNIATFAIKQITHDAMQELRNITDHAIAMQVYEEHLAIFFSELQNALV